MLRGKPDSDHAGAHVGGSGGGWWWHSEEDTYDKADLDILLRDSKVFASFALRIMQKDILPVDLEAMAGKMIDLLKEYQGSLTGDFDLAPVVDRAEALKQTAKKLKNAKIQDKRVFNQLLKETAGRLNALMYTQVSPYYQDVAFDLKAFHGFYRACGVHCDNSTKEEILFLNTDFQRQANRFLVEVSCVIKHIERFLEMNDSLN
jgi:aminopeptidase YwaD